MNPFWLTIISISVICTFLATIRLSYVKSNLFIKNNFALNILFSPYWCFLLIVLLAGPVGELGRGEISPIPWVYILEESKNNYIYGIFSFFNTITLYLWLFWTPAYIYRHRNIDIDNNYIVKKLEYRITILTHIINILTGLILIQEGNFIYKAIAFIGNT